MGENFLALEARLLEMHPFLYLWDNLCERASASACEPLRVPRKIALELPPADQSPTYCASIVKMGRLDGKRKAILRKRCVDLEVRCRVATVHDTSYVVAYSRLCLDPSRAERLCKGWSVHDQWTFSMSEKKMRIPRGAMEFRRCKDIFELFFYFTINNIPVPPLRTPVDLLCPDDPSPMDEGVI